MFDSDFTIKGGVFSRPTQLPGLLGKRMNIVFGRNGSGKSTIARAFREQQVGRLESDAGRNFEFSSDRSGNLQPEICEHSFVFNEDFIDDYIKVEGGLKSIIRIGTSAKLDAPIQEAKAKIKEFSESQKPIRDKIRTLDGSASVKGSIKEADKELKDGLKKPGGYADRLFRINGKQNLVASVLNPVLSIDKDDVLPKSIGETAGKLKDDIERFLSFKSGSPISWDIPSLSRLPDIAAVNEALAQTVRPAELTAEEQFILDELSKELASENFISKTESLIIESPRGFCPLCHQPVSLDHKHTLGQRLVKFRNETVQRFVETVTQLNDGIYKFDVSLPSFPTSEYKEDLNKADACLQKVNSFIDELKAALKKKAENPFSAMKGFDQDAFVSLLDGFQASLSKIAEDVKAYNKTLEEKDSLKKEIDELNIRLAYHENKSWIDAFNARTAEMDNLNNDLQDLDRKIKEQEKIVESLNSQIDQVDDAREQINHYLGIIFGNDKLRLVPAGKEKYKLQVKMDDSFVNIPPKAISSGERNALALAYFFACVLEKKDKNYDYSDPTLLVIDDPVSSFDAENKAGVLSLLSFQFKKVLKGNPQSKVLVFTHDYTTLRGLCEQREQFFPRDNEETAMFLRINRDHKLKSVPCSYILENMEYYNDLQSIYNFANFPEPEDFDHYDTMGNMIRGFAESYATRMFKCKWIDLFSDDRRLGCIPGDRQEKIKAFAIRPVLNSESHGVYRSFEPEEIQRAARVLLVYIFYASRDHLYAYLVGRNSANEDRLDKIKLWADSF